MTEHVISHRRPRRKRPGVWASLTRRLGMLIVTLLALAIATWIAPYVYRPEPPALKSPQRESYAVPSAPPSASPAIPEAAEIARPVVASRARAPHARTSVPLDANPGAHAEDYEVLSAAELDAISQARH